MLYFSLPLDSFLFLDENCEVPKRKTFELFWFGFVFFWTLDRLCLLKLTPLQFVNVNTTMWRTVIIQASDQHREFFMFKFLSPQLFGTSLLVNDTCLLQCLFFAFVFFSILQHEMRPKLSPSDLPGRQPRSWVKGMFQDVGRNINIISLQTSN